MSETIAISLGCSLFVAIIYGVFISNKEEEIRAYLRTSAKGFFRYFYVKALISAVRGKDKVSDTSNIFYILIILSYSLALYFHNDINELLRNHDTTVKSINELIEGKPEQTIEDFSEDLTKIKSSIDDISGKIGFIRIFNEGMYLIAHFIFAVGFIIWRPYLLIQKRFSHEVERLMTRMQGVISTQELSEIAVLECKVVDEETLKLFIISIKGIAKKYDLEELVFNFELWERVK